MTPSAPFAQVVPLPPSGETVRVEKGRLHLLLEHVRGGHLLVVHDGTQSRRYLLGLPRDGGRLELQPRVPEHRVEVAVREALCLAPRGRVRGYVAVPLHHRLVWVRAGGVVDVLLELPASELETAWLGEGDDGGYRHAATSGFFPLVGGAGFAAGPAGTHVLVPVVVCNAAPMVAHPAQLTLTLRERDLRDLRGQLVAAPRRIVLAAGDRQREQLRPLPLGRGQASAVRSVDTELEIPG